MLNKLIYIILPALIISCNSNNVINQTETNNHNNSALKDSLININKYLVKQDAERIKSYIKRQNWNMLVSETGLWYEIYKKTDKLKSKSGLIAKINFTIELLDGTLCYSSDSIGTKTFKLGQGGVESGLEEGLLLMKQGESARFIMPPYLAHGLLGDMEKIPARATIVYYVDLLELSEY